MQNLQKEASTVTTVTTQTPVVAEIIWDISIFEIDKNKGMVNLTKIAKHFGKKVYDWKRLPNIQRFLEAYFKKNTERDNLVTVVGINK